MENKVQKEMVSNILNLSMCANKNCMESRQKLMNNKKVYEKLLSANLEMNTAKKEKLLSEIYKNKLVFDYNNCIFTNCKKMYLNLIKFIEKTLNSTPYPKEKKDKINKLIKEIKTIFNDKILTHDKINKILMNFAIIQSTIFSK